MQPTPEQVKNLNLGKDESKGGKAKGFGNNSQSNKSAHEAGEESADKAIQRIDEIDARKRNLDALETQSGNEMLAVADSEKEGRIQAKREAEAYIKGYADQNATNQIKIGSEMQKLRGQRKQALEFAHSTNGSSERDDSFDDLTTFDMEAFKRQVLAAKSAPKN